MVDWVPYHITDDDLKAAMREHGYVVDDVDNMPRSKIEYLSAPARDGQRYGTDTLPNRMTRIIESVVVDLLDGINVDVSGSAGMGKSVLVRNVSKIISLLTGRDVILCAPTGIAAVNVHGRTVYSEFGGSYDLVEYLDNYVLNVKHRPSDAELARRKAERRAELDRDPDPQVRKRTVSNSDVLRDNECLGDQTTEYGVAHTEGFKTVNRPKGAADSTDADERWWRTYNSITNADGLHISENGRPGCSLTELLRDWSVDAFADFPDKNGYGAQEFVEDSLCGWKASACIIIDEISMCATWQFEAIAEAMRRLNGRFAGPGLRVPLMVVGDFLQLSPVVTDEEPEKYAYRNRARKAYIKKLRKHPDDESTPDGIDVDTLSELSNMSDRKIIKKTKFYDAPEGTDSNDLDRWIDRHLAWRRMMRPADACGSDEEDNKTARGYYAFDSHLWDQMEFSYYELTQPLRQRSEAEYARALRLVRIGDERGLSWIIDHMDDTPDGERREPSGPCGLSEIHSRKDYVADRNNAMLDEDVHVHVASDRKHYNENVHVMWARETDDSDGPVDCRDDDLPVPPTQRFADGAYVMLMRNGTGVVAENEADEVVEWPKVTMDGDRVTEVDWNHKGFKLARSGEKYYNGDRGRIVCVQYRDEHDDIERALVEVADRKTDDGKPVLVVVERTQLGFNGDYLSNPDLFGIARRHVVLLRQEYESKCGGKTDKGVIGWAAFKFRFEDPLTEGLDDLSDVGLTFRDAAFNQFSMKRLLEDPELARDKRRPSRYFRYGCDYFPMTLAYAYTYHKSQGQTLGPTDVSVNIKRNKNGTWYAGGIFTFGQFYVGVSRCEHVGDLRIMGFNDCPSYQRFAVIRDAMARVVSKDARTFDRYVTWRASVHAGDKGLRRLDDDVRQRYLDRYPDRERDRIGAVAWAWLLVWEQHHSSVWRDAHRDATDDGQPTLEEQGFGEQTIFAADPDTLRQAMRRGWPQRFCGVEEFRDAWSNLYEWVPKSLRKRVVDVVTGFDGVSNRELSGDEDEVALKEWRKVGGKRGGVPWLVDAGVGSPVARPGRAHFAPVSKALGDAWFEWFEPDADGGYVKIDRGDVWSYVLPRPVFDDELLASGPDFD